jgi:RimJ/RimL family protein N-acetyltransferase
MLTIRPATDEDRHALWAILEPIIRAGETYGLPRDMSRRQALDYWLESRHEVFAAEADGVVVGTYFLRPNYLGGGAHVANCGYMTASAAAGRTMCEHSLEHAKNRGFISMQFNLVVSSNERAVQLWKRLGFSIVGQLPRAFLHPVAGYVDAYVMFRDLE